MGDPKNDPPKSVLAPVSLQRPPLTKVTSSPAIFTRDKNSNPNGIIDQKGSIRDLTAQNSNLTIKQHGLLTTNEGSRFVTVETQIGADNGDALNLNLNLNNKKSNDLVRQTHRPRKKRSKALVGGKVPTCCKIYIYIC